MLGWLLRKGIQLASSKALGKLVRVFTGTDDNATQITLAEIEGEMEARQHARDIRLATAGFWEMRFIAGVIAGCFAFHLVAVTLDTVLQLGWAIPKYPSPFDEWQGAILLSFFGVQLAQRAMSTLAAIFFRKK